MSNNKKESKVMRFDKMQDGLFNFYKTTIARRKNKLWEYKGPDTTSNCLLATSPPISKQLTKEFFEWNMDNYGVSPIEILITAALQLGIQQGINMCNENPSRYIENEKFDNILDETFVKFLKDGEL